MAGWAKLNNESMTLLTASAGFDKMHGRKMHGEHISSLSSLPDVPVEAIVSRAIATNVPFVVRYRVAGSSESSPKCSRDVTSSGLPPRGGKERKCRSISLLLDDEVSNEDGARSAQFESDEEDTPRQWVQREKLVREKASEHLMAVLDYDRSIKTSFVTAPDLGRTTYVEISGEPCCEDSSSTLLVVCDATASVASELVSIEHDALLNLSADGWARVSGPYDDPGGWTILHTSASWDTMFFGRWVVVRLA